MNYEPIENLSASERKRRETYPIPYQEGYRFRSNCEKKLLDEEINLLKSEGLEVFVGDYAYFGRDKVEEAPSSTKTILVRKKKN